MQRLEGIGGAGPGLNANERLVLNGPAPTLTTGGIVAPSILGQNNDANKSGDFLTYAAGTKEVKQKQITLERAATLSSPSSHMQ